jgi:hypothetical protein
MCNINKLDEYPIALLGGIFMHYMSENNQHQLRQLENEGFRDIKGICKKYKRYHVIAYLQDGSMMDGIIEDMDDDSVTMLVPEDVEEDDRQFDYGGYGGYGRRRFRRFRRRRFPFNFFLFPFFIPYPYYYPY